jgi:hypothetical protein
VIHRIANWNANNRRRKAMANRISRRAFGAAVAGGAAILAKSAAEAQAPAQQQEEQRDYPAPTFKPTLRKPRLGSLLVQDFVIFAHYDLDMVKKLLEKDPAVLNSTVDWGGGDWESALGGASHMGRRDIAEFLLEKGARIDIFAAAMLGNLDAVKGLLAAHPSLIDAKGPHGIPLLAHAKAGKKEAETVLAYLEKLKSGG